MPNHSQPNAVFSNRSFIDDESNPPSYNSIYPIPNDKNAKSTGTTNENNSNVGQQPASNNPNTNLLVSSLFQNSTQEPISYDELYSTRFLFAQNGRVEANHDTSSAVPATAVFTQPPYRNHNQSNNSSAHNNHLYSSYSQGNRVRKQFHIIFTKSYLLKHFIFISVSSMMIILFQIILMNNQSILSHLAGGIWCGLTNLFTLLITITTRNSSQPILIILNSKNSYPKLI